MKQKTIFLLALTLLNLLICGRAFAVYDPTEGRWISRDPLGEREGTNLYRYVLNDPVYWVDPSGLGPAPNFGPATDAGLLHVIPSGGFVFGSGEADGPGGLNTEGVVLGGITGNTQPYGAAIGAVGKSCKANIGGFPFGYGAFGGWEQGTDGGNPIGLGNLDIGPVGFGGYSTPSTYGGYAHVNFGNVSVGVGLEWPR